MAHDIAGEGEDAAPAAPILPGVPTPAAAAAPPTFTTQGQFDAIQNNQVANNQGTRSARGRRSSVPRG